MARRLEATHGSLTLARRLERVLRSIVQSSMATMLNFQYDFLLGGCVVAQLVRDHDSRHILAVFEQLAEELPGCGCVPPALHQNIEDVAVLIDRRHK